MLNLVIDNEKYLILNLDKEPNFVPTFSLKSYSSFMRHSFIVKFVEKTALSLLSWFQN